MTGGLQRGCSQLPPLLKRYPSRLRVEYLDTDVICSCIQVFVYTLDHDFHVTPRDECINEPITALPQEVVVGEAEAAPVVGVVRQVEVPGDVSPTDRPGLVRVCLQHHRLFRQEPAVGAESGAGPCRVLRCDEVRMSALGSLGCQREHPRPKRSEYTRWSHSWLHRPVSAGGLVHSV